MLQLSIIVPCLNSSKTIAQCLSAIRASNFKNYELIVVDDTSKDDTVAIAKRYADKVISLNENKGSGNARNIGIQNASADILCFIDSDIIIPPTSLLTIITFLNLHPEVDAVTGLLSKDHPNKDFFSQYKNLYMNYTFSLLPQRVTFIFGSIYAMRKRTGHSDQGHLRYTPDTEYGQKLVERKKNIAFLKNLEVVHLKTYTFISLMKNDFLIPFSWAKIFVRFQGWQQLGKNQTGFAHAPTKQLTSVLTAPTLASLSITGIFSPHISPESLLLLIIWFYLNIGFLLFLLKERGIIFFLASILITFIDQIVMFIGIICGLCSYLFI